MKGRQWVLFLCILARHVILFLSVSFNYKMNRFTSCWVINWLSGRAQRAVVNKAVSGWWPASNGVPQGSSVWTVLTFLLEIWMQELDVSIANLLIIHNWEILLTL